MLRASASRLVPVCAARRVGRCQGVRVMANMARSEVLNRPYRFTLVSDLDWTMVNHADAVHEDLLRFNRLWLTRLAPQPSLLVFSTGRSPQLFHELAAEVPLLTPDVLVCSVGTEILINGEPDEEWEAYLNQGWDRQKAAAIAAELPELVMQQPSEQRPHKVSYKVHAGGDPQRGQRVVDTLRERLAAAGLDAGVVYSAGVDVDILPSRASKGKALAFLLKQLESAGGRPSSGVLVCGDSGNDCELFAVPGVHGCMVANAHPELKEWCEAHGGPLLFKATADGPGGILQAIEHFGFAKQQPEGQPSPAMHIRDLLVSLHQSLEAWLGATTHRSGPRALPAHLAPLLALDYTHVDCQGAVLDRAQLLAAHEARFGCEADVRAVAPDPLAQPPNDAPAIEEEQREGEGEGEGGEVGGGEERPGAAVGHGGKPPSSTHRYRVWLDQVEEREVGVGTWLARYLELHQPFTAGAHTRENRTARRVSVLLRERGQGGEQEGGRYQVVTSHETKLPHSSSEGGHGH